MSLILNILTEISVIQWNTQMLPQIRIDDVEAESCLNVAAIICPNNLHLVIIFRLGTCVRSTLLRTLKSFYFIESNFLTSENFQVSMRSIQ
jgi:hypothetical protein